MSLSITLTQPDPFIAMSKALAHQKTKPRRVTELYESIQAVEKNDSNPIDVNTLTSRITILEKLKPNKVLPERTFCFHMSTFGVSYISVKIYDQVRANKILNKKQRLIDQYLTQIFTSIDTDPSHINSLIEILKDCSPQNLRKILIYARQEKHQELAIQCNRWITHNNNGYNQLSENNELLLALHDQNTEALQALLANGAHVNFYIDHYFMGERTPLPLLAWIFHRSAGQFAQTLINAGADINLKTHYGKTILMLGASTNQLDLVNFLIQAQAALNLQDTSGYTALIHAVLKANIEISLALIDAGAQPNLQISHNLYKAEWLHRERIRAEQEQRTLPGVGDTALTLAASQGNEKLVSALINIRADLNLQTETKHTALTRAIVNRRSNSALLLIEAGAKLNLQTTSGHTALMLAVSKGLPQVVSCLIKKNAALDVQLHDGRTALIFAIENNQVEIALQLIKAGANWNLYTYPEPGQPAKTALFLAKERQQLPVINALNAKRTTPHSILEWIRSSNTAPLAPKNT